MTRQELTQHAHEALARYDEWAKNLQRQADEGLARLAAMRQRNNMAVVLTNVTKERAAQINSDLRQRSGNINYNGALIAFLYTLLRDHMQPGDVEALVRDATENSLDGQYSNGWLARYAEDLAKRLLDETKAVP